MKYYIVTMNFVYDEESDYNNIIDLVVTDSEQKAKEISDSLNNLARAYRDHLASISKFKREYIHKNPRPILEKPPAFSSKSPPSYDDDRYMTVSKEYFEKYAEHLRVTALAEREYKLKSDKWVADLEVEIRERFSFKFDKFKYHTLLGEDPDLKDGDADFYYFEIDFIKS